MLIDTHRHCSYTRCRRKQMPGSWGISSFRYSTSCGGWLVFVPSPCATAPAAPLVISVFLLPFTETSEVWVFNPHPRPTKKLCRSDTRYGRRKRECTQYEVQKGYSVVFSPNLATLNSKIKKNTNASAGSCPRSNGGAVQILQNDPYRTRSWSVAHVTGLKPGARAFENCRVSI